MRHVPDQRGADQLAVADDDRLVDAVPGLGVLDELVVGMLGSLDAHRRDVDAGHLELGGHPRTVVGRRRVGAGQVVGEHRGLLPQRRHQPVHLAAVLGALADDVDVVVVDRAHVVVDDDRAFDGQPGPLCQADVRPDAGRDHQHVAVEPRAVGEQRCRSSRPSVDVGTSWCASPGARRCRGPPPTCAGSRRPGRRAGRSSASAPACTTSTVRPAVLQSAGRLQAEQSAADHDRLGPVRGLGDHGRRCRRGCGSRTRRRPASCRRPTVPPSAGRTTGCRWPGSACRSGVVVPSSACTRWANVSMPHHPHPGPQVDAVVGVPVQRVEIDLGRIIAAGKHIRQQDAVVVAVRLVAEDGDVENGRRRPAARISSTARMPAMPLPTTTSRCGHQISTRPRSTIDRAAAPRPVRRRSSSSTVSAEQILDHPQRDVGGALGGDREVAHRLSVAEQHHRDHLLGGVAAAEVHRLGGGAGRHHVAQRVVDRHRLVVAVALERRTRPAGSAVCCRRSWLEARSGLFRSRFARNAPVDPCDHSANRLTVSPAAGVRASFHSRSRRATDAE